MQDTLSGLYGIYSIREDRWVCRPEYTGAYRIHDGFCLERGAFGKLGESESWQSTFDLADKNGTIIKTGIQSEDEIWETERFANLFLEPKEFAEKYPDILESLSAEVDDIWEITSMFIILMMNHVRSFCMDITQMIKKIPV